MTMPAIFITAAFSLFAIGAAGLHYLSNTGMLAP